MKFFAEKELVFIVLLILVGFAIICVFDFPLVFDA
jgi:hypothetical protein